MNNIFETNFEDDFNNILASIGASVKINGNQQTAMITNIKNKDIDFKTIRTNFPISTGDIVEYQNSNWLITSEVQKTNTYRATLRKINYNLKFNFNKNVKIFPVIVDTKIFDVQNNQYVNMASGKIMVTLQRNPDTDAIVLQQKFIHTARVFQVTGIDKVRSGLITLYCDLYATGGEDDLVNEISGVTSTTHNYALNIQNGDTIQVLLSNTKQLDTVVKDKGVIMNPQPPLLFTSSDNNVLSVDNNGNIMGINLGFATVAVQMKYATNIKDTININVVETLTQNYSIAITGSATVREYQNLDYIAHVYDNGTEVTDQSVTWTMKNIDNTVRPYATVTTQTGNSCNVKGGDSIDKVVRLTATLNGVTPPVIGTFDITIKSMFGV